MSGGDVYPIQSNITQTFSAIVLLYFASFVNFYLLGKFGTLVEQMSARSSSLQMKLDQTNEIMAYIKLTYENQLTLREFYFKT